MPRGYTQPKKSPTFRYARVFFGPCDGEYHPYHPEFLTYQFMVPKGFHGVYHWQAGHFFNGLIEHELWRLDGKTYIFRPKHLPYELRSMDACLAHLLADPAIDKQRKTRVKQYQKDYGPGAH
jgi:hypothetical protein